MVQIGAAAVSMLLGFRVSLLTLRMKYFLDRDIAHDHHGFVMSWRFVGGAAGIGAAAAGDAPFGSYVKMLFFVQALW